MALAAQAGNDNKMLKVALFSALYRHVFFNVACRKGGKGLKMRHYKHIIRAGDEANVIAQQCCARFKNSQQQLLRVKGYIKQECTIWAGRNLR